MKLLYPCKLQTTIITWYIQHKIQNVNLVISFTAFGIGKLNTISVFSWIDTFMTFALLFWGWCPIILLNIVLAILHMLKNQFLSRTKY